jgi:hypothetical protein
MYQVVRQYELETDLLSSLSPSYISASFTAVSATLSECLYRFSGNFSLTNCIIFERKGYMNIENAKELVKEKLPEKRYKHSLRDTFSYH